VVHYLDSGSVPVPAVHSSGDDRKGGTLMQYLREPMFYVAVAVAAVVINFIWRLVFGGKLV
jgi:hypothetical protein